MKKKQFLLFILILLFWQSNSGFSQRLEFAAAKQIATGFPRPGKTISPVERVVSIGVGIVAGGFLGGFVGGAIGKDFVSIFRGGAVGMSVFPFLTYEIMLAKKNITNPLNQCWLSGGGNVLFVSHSEAQTSNRKMFGFNRVYHLSGNSFFRGELFYTSRRFDLSNQRIYYSSMSSSSVNKANIHFAVDYLDVNLLFDFKVWQSGNWQIHLGTGPAYSVPVRTLTQYDWLERKAVENYVSDCDFHFIGEEPSETFLFFGWVSNVELQFKRLALRLRFNYGLDSSYQIYPLLEHTKMNTLELLVGFRLRGVGHQNRK